MSRRFVCRGVAPSWLTQTGQTPSLFCVNQVNNARNRLIFANSRPCSVTTSLRMCHKFAHNQTTVKMEAIRQNVKPFTSNTQLYKLSNFKSVISCGQIRYYSSFANFSPEDYSIMESWNYVVNPFGKVTVKGALNVYIEPVNVHEHPLMDVAYITVYAKKEEENKPEEFSNTLNCDIQLLDLGKHIQIKGPKHCDKPLHCHIQVPIKFGVEIEQTDDSRINISNVESSQLELKTKNGDCVLNNIRAGVVKVFSESGNIKCEKGTLGNVQLETGNNGTIHADKLQGSHIKLRTDTGDMSVKSVYGETTVFWTNRGTVRLGSCHGNTSVDTYNADVYIDSLEGDLSAVLKSGGNLDLYLARHGKGEVTLGDGDITLRLPETVHTEMELTAGKIVIDESFQTKNLENVPDKKYKVVSGDITLRLPETVHTEMELTAGKIVIDESFQTKNLENVPDKKYKVVSGTLGDPERSEVDVTGRLNLKTYKGTITLQCYNWFKAISNSTAWRS